MLPIKSTQFFARLMLALWMLSVSVAGATALIAPQASHVVCSAMGAKLVTLNAEGIESESTTGTLAAVGDCPLCGQAAVPAPEAASLAASPSLACHAPTLTQAQTTRSVVHKPHATGPPQP